MITARRTLMLALFILAVALPASLGANTIAPGNGAMVRYTLAKAAQVSLNIYGSDGVMVRELLDAAPRSAGEHIEAWDGRDDQDNPLPAGRYSFKVLATQGLHCEYLTTVGTNPTPAWATWPGNHNGIHAVAADATGYYFAGGSGEGDPLIVKEDPQGKRLWSVDNWVEAWNGGHSMSVANGVVYMMQGNVRVQEFDSANGKFLRTIDPIWDPDDRAHDDQMIVGLKHDLAARGDTLVMSFEQHNAVRWIDQVSGKTLAEASVPSPKGVAIAADGTVFVASDQNIISVTEQNTTPVIVISGLDDPTRLDIDDTTGDLLVACNGATFQVLRYSRDGKLLRSYGTKGGRPPNGRFDPNGFQTIYDIASDGHGGFITAESESPPRRTAHWDKGGHLLRAWYGGQQYASFASADPADPTLIWSETAWNCLTEWKVDYSTKAIYPYADYQYGGLAGDQVGGSRSGNWFVRHHGGWTYLVRDNHITVLRVDEAGRQLVPCVVAQYTPWFWAPAGGYTGFVKDERVHLGLDTRNDSPSWLWEDLNGDGKPSFDEAIGAPVAPLPKTYCSFSVGPDFTYYISGGDWQADPQGGVWAVHVKKWLPSGVPIYETGSEIKQIVLNSGPVSHVGQGELAAFPDSVGNIMTAYSWDAKPGRHLQKAAKWSADGKILWMSGKLSPGTKPAPGQVRGLNHTVGVVHDCVVVADYYDSMDDVWNRDGLWVGRLLDNPNLNAAPAEAYNLCGENFSGSLWQNPTTGAVLLFGGGQNNSPVYRITGWDQFVSSSGFVDLSKAAEAAATVAVAKQEATDGVRIPYVAAAKIGADMTALRSGRPLVIYDGSDIRATVYVSWNASGLFALYDVNTDSPWKSAGSEQLPFQGGAAVDAYVGPVDAASNAVEPGDERIVAAPIDDSTNTQNRGTEAVEMYPLLPTDLAAADRNPAQYQTGLGTVAFDRVKRLQGPDYAYFAPKPGGYYVELRTPVHAPASLQAGQQLRFDVSVILSNPTGTSSANRLLWHSTDPSDQMTQDTYTEALFRPANWGLIELW